MPELRMSPLHEVQAALSPHLIEFAGWLLPGWYSSIVSEHQAVRNRCGLFDVSHLGRMEISGRDALPFLQHLLTVDIASVQPGHTRYTLMCQQDGGIVDDITVFHLEAGEYLLVVNAVAKDRDVDWIHRVAAEYSVLINDISSSTAMVALQGPDSVAMLEETIAQPLSTLAPFACVRARVNNRIIISRTGYTGENGFELQATIPDVIEIWKLLLGKGVTPCGLGARDTLRLEAGMALYGNDIDTSTNPLEAGLGWLIDWNKGDFIGRDALLATKERGVTRRLVGFRMLGRELARSGQKVLDSGDEVGTVTSGSYSPTLKVGIGMSYVQKEIATTGRDIEILVRDHPAAAQIVKKPFYKRSSSQD